MTPLRKGGPSLALLNPPDVAHLSVRYIFLLQSRAAILVHAPGLTPMADHPLPPLAMPLGLGQVCQGLELLGFLS